MERSIAKYYLLLLMCAQLWFLHLECRQAEHHKKQHATNVDALANLDEHHAVNMSLRRRAMQHNYNKNNKNHKNKKNFDNYNEDIEQQRHERPKKHSRRQHYASEQDNIALWINEQQLQMLSALLFPHSSSHRRLYIIEDGHVLHDIRDVTHIYKFLTIPAEVKCVNFTWKSGGRKFNYNFDKLETLDDSILEAPTLSIKTKGRVPMEEKSFSIFLPCAGNVSGTAMFTIGLSIQNRRGVPLPGTPLRVNFKKECAHRGVYDSLDASNPSTLKTLQGSVYKL